MGVKSTPLDIRKLLGVDEINVAGDRRLESVLPRREFSQNRKYFRLHIVKTGHKNIRYLSFMYEYRDLRFFDRNGGLIVYFSTLIFEGIFINESIIAVVVPYDVKSE